MKMVEFVRQDVHSLAVAELRMLQYGRPYLEIESRRTRIDQDTLLGLQITHTEQAQT